MILGNSIWGMIVICFVGLVYGPDLCTHWLVLVLLVITWHGSNWGVF